MARHGSGSAVPAHDVERGARACIEVAIALGYIPTQPELTDTWDEVERPLRKLMR